MRDARKPMRVDERGKRGQCRKTAVGIGVFACLKNMAGTASKVSQTGVHEFLWMNMDEDNILQQKHGQQAGHGWTVSMLDTDGDVSQRRVAPFDLAGIRLQRSFFGASQHGH